MRVPHGSYVLVADGRKRLFARNEGEADQPTLKVVQAAEQASRATHDIATDAAGRTPAAQGARGGGGGAPYETNDPHQNAEDDFAVETADLLRREAEQGSYEQLIVIAPPKTLGVLRKHYHKLVTDRLIGEIDKDLTGQPMDAIEKLILAQ